MSSRSYSASVAIRFNISRPVDVAGSIPSDTDRTPIPRYRPEGSDEAVPIDGADYVVVEAGEIEQLHAAFVQVEIPTDGDDSSEFDQSVYPPTGASIAQQGGNAASQ